MNILKRRYTELETALRRYEVSGEYRMVVRRIDGSIKQDTGWFENLILDSGLNRVGTGAAKSTCAIGTGTATPDAAQTSLASLSASTTNIISATQGAAASSPYYYFDTIQYRFALGDLNGNYSEVGIGWGASTLFSRALIVDSGGSPTTISVLSSEQLDVIYRLRLYVPLSDWADTKVISGVSHTITGRAGLATGNLWGSNNGILNQSAGVQCCSSANAGFVWNGSLGAITATPSGTSAAGVTGTNATYSNNSYQRDGTYTFGLTNANLSGGIKSLNVESRGLGYSQYEFSPNIAKDSTKTLILNFRSSWARRP